MATKDKEIWKQIPNLKGSLSKKYAVSSHGRLASYEKNIEDKYILKQHLNGGFPMVTLHSNGKSKALFAHQAVGAAFLKKHSPKCKFVLHLDYNKENNSISNLKWATKEQQVEHSKKSPYVLAAAAHKVYSGATSKKLNEKKVIQLKNEIWNPKRKLTFKQLAAKYGIAEMNLYRIKNGELWFHVHVEGEPIFPKYKAQLKNIEFHEKAASKASVTKAAKEKKAVAKKVAPKKAVVKKVAVAKKVTVSKPIELVKAKKVKVKKDKKGKKEKKAKKKNKK